MVISSAAAVTYRSTLRLLLFHVQSAQSADSRSDKSGHDVVQSFTAGLRRRSDTHYGPQVPQRLSLHSHQAFRTTETDGDWQPAAQHHQ
jgi:hypothetical protein